MRVFSPRSLLVTVVVSGLFSVAAPSKAGAQKPSPDQVQQLLRNPALMEQLRQRISTSGLTPDQIRARLRAEGYPEGLLDAYLGASIGNDQNIKPSEDVYAAIRQLGLSDSTDILLIRCGIDPDTLSAADDPAAIPNPAQRAAAMNAAADTVDAKLAARKKKLADRCMAIEQLESDSKLAKQVVDSGYTLFGLDFFRKQTTVFNPNTGGPVDASYRVGPGDQLALILTGDVEEAHVLDVTREGFIVVPQVGQIQVNNLTIAQLEAMLQTRLSKVYSGIGRTDKSAIRFSVSPTKLRSNLIYVTGNVLSPGAYRISSAGTLLSALYVAGGPTDNGSLRGIEVRRGGALVTTFDFYDYLIKGDATHDVRLQNGDVVFVPVHLPRTRVVGEFVRPATYEIKPTETIADAIRLAEGFTANAARSRIQIERILPPAQRAPGRDRTMIDVALTPAGTADGIALSVEPGDVIRAFMITGRVRNEIRITGNVNTPGTQGLEPGMTLSTALRRAGLKSDTYLGRILVTRLQPDSTRIQMRAELKDVGGDVVEDFALQEDDEIRVFSKTEFRPVRYVAINGAVQKSGQYPYREGMTVRDLVLLAGGLQQSAYLNEAKIARLPSDRSDSRTAQEFSVALDSSYLFERGRDGRYFGPPGLPASAGPSTDVTLSPYDNVLILRQPDWELQRTVVISGEVRFPGRYSLLHKNDKITDIVKRAGGLTPEGYANGVIFYRKRSGVGRIGIDLPEVLKDPRSRDNLLLQDQDSIYIPRFSSIISVQGAVNSPLAVSFTPGKDLYYYVNAAGGPTGNADLGRAYVTQPNGKVESIAKRFLIPNGVPVPKPGSIIYVPTKGTTTRSIDPVTLIGAIGAILSSLVTIVVVLSNQ